MVDTNLLPRSLREEKHIRWRGGEVSRIEGLSDAIFALSLTLLVVALEVPRTSDELIAVFWQFPAFALCFAFILWVWYEHFLYHRRFGFEDWATVALNGVLLFFVVFYVFPLKFLASALITGSFENADMDVVFGSHGTAVMVFYSAGFVGIFTVLALMYWRAWRLRDVLQLDAAEREAVRGAIRGHLLSISIGVLSLALAVLVPNVPALAGLVYFLMGPAQGFNGFRTGNAIERAASETSLKP
jgi:uncharacterized membrane protein